MTNLRLRVLLSSALVFFGLIIFASTCFGQAYDGVEKGRMKSILRIVKDEVKKNYYDPEYHGINLDERFKKAEEKLETATSTGQALAIIAQVLIDFDDSHLYLSPPSTNLAVEYGWRMQTVGDKVVVTQVKPGSDAEAKGLKPGDQVLAVSGFRPSRKELWKVLYYYNIISKRNALTLSIVSPGADTPRDVEIKSQIKNRPQKIVFETYFRLFDDFYDEENDKHRFWKYGGVTVWKMPSFAFDPKDVDSLMDNVRNGSSVVLDLRGNGGGYVKALEALVGLFFDRDIKIAELKGRKKMDPINAKTRGKAVYPGKVIVIVDSDSGSAAEMFARVIQLEQRGKVIGDISSGSVMQAQRYESAIGTMSVVPFYVSVTNADVIMSDGKSLERVGVVPDELILPTGMDLAAKRDPVLARAIELLGGSLSAEEAGKLSKYYWKKD